jgi:hypothetical protein
VSGADAIGKFNQRHYQEGVRRLYDPVEIVFDVPQSETMHRVNELGELLRVECPLGEYLAAVRKTEAA